MDSRAEETLRGSIARWGLLARAAVLAAALGVFVSGASLVKGTDVFDSGVASASTGQSAQTLIVAAAEAPSNFDQEQSVGAANFDAMVNTMRPALTWRVASAGGGLRQEDPTRLAPQLARTWSATSNLRRFTFGFRPGVVSHAGNELTADDYIYTWRRLLGLNVAGSFFGPLIGLTKPNQIRKVSKYVVEIRLPKPSPLFLPIHTHHALYILDSKDMQAHATSGDPWSKNWLAKNPSGFGPYKLQSLRSGQEATFTADAGYARISRPTIRTVIYRAVAQSANRLAVVSTGAADIALDLSPRELQTLERNSNVTVKSWKANRMYRMPLNFKSKPFDNPNVRRALAYAMPYEQIRKAVWLGYATPMDDSVAPSYPGYTRGAWKFKHNLTRARELLQRAGFEDGFSFEMAYGTDSAVHEQVATQIRTEFAKLNIDVKLTKLPQGTLADRTYNKKNVPAWIHQDQAIVPDGGYSDGVWMDSKSFYNYNNYRNPTVDRLLRASNTEANRAARLRTLRRAQRLIANDVTWIYIAFPGFQAATRKNVSGPVWSIPNTVRFDTMRKG